MEQMKQNCILNKIEGLYLNILKYSIDLIILTSFHNKEITLEHLLDFLFHYINCEEKNPTYVAFI